jgi:unsaturated rhamnogalacturonyl hydrolase
MGDILLAIEGAEAREAVRKVAAKTMAMDLPWDWPCGVAYYGLCRAWETTGDGAIMEFLAAWVDRYVELGLPPFMVNAMAMGHCLLSLHQATGERRYLDLAIRKAEYLRAEAVRFGEGVFQHTVSAKNDFPGQAWADTLFMAAYFLLRMGRFLGDDGYVRDALNQYYWHEEFLQDPATDLFYHGYEHGGGTHMSGLFWARGNAWAAFTMAKALKLIDYTYPMFMRIDGALRDQLAALVRLQDSGGLWHTVLDYPESYLETSASCGFGAALVANGNPLHRAAAAKAYRGLLERIRPDGGVLGVSAGTAVMKNREDYCLVPNKRIQGWGQGLALAFLAELLDYQAAAAKS